MQWSLHFDKCGPKRVNQAACELETKIYSFGGYSKALSSTELRSRNPIDVYVFNSISFKWFKRPVPKEDDPQYTETPYFRYGHTCVSYEPNGLIYLYGGRADWANELCNKLYAYDPSKHHWAIVNAQGTIPDGRDGHSACVMRSCMYIFGGFVQRIERFSNDLFEFNFDSETWSMVIPKSLERPHWRDFHTATPIGNKMYIFGGRMDAAGAEYSGESFYSNHVYEFDFDKSVWTNVTEESEDYNTEYRDGNKYPCGRRSHSAVPYGKKILVFGGYNEELEVHFDDLLEFDTESYTWEFLKVRGKAPSNRRRHCCCVINSRMILFGGTGPKVTDRYRVASLLHRLQQNQALLNLDNNEQDLPVNVFEDIERFLEMIQMPPDYSSSEESGGSDDDNEDVPNPRKLFTKADLYVLDLEIPKLKELCKFIILDKKLNYEDSYLPKALKLEIDYLLNSDESKK